MGANVNHHYQEVKESYLFAEIAKRIRTWQENNPEIKDKLIRMGIGDVTLPLPKTVVEALAAASVEMGKSESFHGYGPEQGYDFLREKILSYYKNFSVDLEMEEIFVSDGAKSDLGNILDLFAPGSVALVPDPVYPVYVDTNIMVGNKVVFAESSEENGFLPVPPKGEKVDLIYLCSPNNPTGAVYDHEGLRAWVDYAKENAKIIMETLDALSIYYTGGKNSPYVWLKCPKGMSSWEFFDFLLEKGQVVGTPGAGFGDAGEGFFRLTAFSTKEKTKEAMERIKMLLET